MLILHCRMWCDCCSATKAKTKWASIRSSFARELRVERECTKSGSGKRKCSVYIYTRQMAFMRPFMRLKQLHDNSKSFKTVSVHISGNNL